jgi:hypothetical protein
MSGMSSYAGTGVDRVAISDRASVTIVLDDIIWDAEVHMVSTVGITTVGILSSIVL